MIVTRPLPNPQEVAEANELWAAWDRFREEHPDLDRDTVFERFLDLLRQRRTAEREA